VVGRNAGGHGWSLTSDLNANSSHDQATKSGEILRLRSHAVSKVGTPVRGGATYREAHLAMEIIADHGRMLSFEIVEVNPVIDEHNRTGDMAVEVALSVFGKKIL
jgi:Arginase family